MRALEFKSRIKNNKVQNPEKIRSELKQDKDIRVIVLFDYSDNNDEFEFRRLATEKLLKEYAESDSIYDQT